MKKIKSLWIIQSISILTIITLSIFIYKSNLFGDKNKTKDIMKEIENNKENKLVTNDEDSLKVALSVQKAIQNVAQSVGPSVVNIRTVRIQKQRRGQRGMDPFNFFDFFGDDFGGGPRKLQSLGSGFVISKKGYIVTNNHVVKDADQITILFSDEKEFKGKIVGRDTKTDIAVIKIDPKEDLPITPLGDSDKTNIGDFAIAIGNPFGLSGSFTLGVISARGRDNIDDDAGYKNYIQTDASINQGNSGGPLLNIMGQAIGMNTAIFSIKGGSVGIGFAIPINIVKKVVESIIEKGFVERGYLGVSAKPIPEDVAKLLGIDKKRIIINFVEQGSPADKGGIRTGDVILKVNDKNINTFFQLQNIIGSHRRGDTVKIQVLRNKEKLDVQVTLGQAHDNITKSDTKSSASNNSFFGLVVGSISDNYNRFRINKKLKGVVVLEVEEDSPADNAGIQAGDIIQSINYTDIKKLSDFQNFISKNLEDKKSFLVKIRRRNLTDFKVIEKK